LITGGNRGLGFATAARLAGAGVRTVIGARRLEDGERAAQAIRDDGGDATAVELDVRSADSIARATRTVDKRHGRLDILVNNAGILPEATSAGDRPVDAVLFRETYETNVFGAVATIEGFLPLLERSDSAHVVNVSSTMGSLTDQSDPSSPYYSVVVPAYSSSKAALNAVTVTLAKALEEPGVRVNAVCPAFVQTDLTPISREQAPISADEAAQAVVDVALDGERTGTFVDANGTVGW
jgi:NAD(P)-dependent dehydrogenase (short-subunit alcohol dehydrogenase family)